MSLFPNRIIYHITGQGMTVCNFDSGEIKVLGNLFKESFKIQKKFSVGEKTCIGYLERTGDYSKPPICKLLVIDNNSFETIIISLHQLTTPIRNFNYKFLELALSGNLLKVESIENSGGFIDFGSREPLTFVRDVLPPSNEFIRISANKGKAILKNICPCYENESYRCVVELTNTFNNNGRSYCLFKNYFDSPTTSLELVFIFYDSSLPPAVMNINLFSAEEGFQIRFAITLNETGQVLVMGQEYFLLLEFSADGLDLLNEKQLESSVVKKMQAIHQPYLIPPTQKDCEFLAMTIGQFAYLHRDVAMLIVNYLKPKPAALGGS